MKNKKLKILIVDDDIEVTRSVGAYLEQAGYSVVTLNDSRKVLDVVQDERPDLVVLDIIMPGTDGIDLCKEIRKLPKYYPIILLTSKSEVVDKVVGLEIGADDYVSKPFSLRELEARIKAVLRRKIIEIQTKEDIVYKSVIKRGNLLIDIKNRVLKVNDKKVTLTPKEFEMMRLFMSYPGRAFTRDELLEKIWGDKFKGFHRTVDSHVNRLRTKIEPDPNKPNIITTVWGVGYKFNEDYSSDH